MPAPVQSTAPPTEIKLYDDKLVIPFEIAPGISKDREVSLDQFIENISSQALLDTGLMPVSGTGLLGLRQFGKYRQITFQIEPDLSYVTWGRSEGQHDKPTYYVASPYRVIIADVFDGDLLGARMFYSPEPITSPDQVLHHINLPNVNCKGYGQGNGVGWLCLYLKESWKSLDITGQIHGIVERAGGGEAYNDANMSRTDGARFYQGLKRDQKHLWDASTWQKYSKDNGYAWTLEPDVWIPVLVKSADEQIKHVDDGVPLTIDMAMRGTYKAYYHDATPLKPVNAASRPDKVITDSTNKVDGHGAETPFSMRSLIERSVIMAEPYGRQVISRPIIHVGDKVSAIKWAAGTINERTKTLNEGSEVIDFAPKAIGTSKLSKIKIYEGQGAIEIAHFGLVLETEITDELFVTDAEGTKLFAADCFFMENTEEGQEGSYIHNSVPHETCTNCGVSHLVKPNEIIFYKQANDPVAFCVSCTETHICSFSGKILPAFEIQAVDAFNPATDTVQTYYISNDQFSHMTRCMCNLLVQHAATNELGNGNVCAGCVQIAPNGQPSYVCGITINTPNHQGQAQVL